MNFMKVTMSMRLSKKIFTKTNMMKKVLMRKYLIVLKKYKTKYVKLHLHLTKLLLYYKFLKVFLYYSIIFCFFLVALFYIFSHPRNFNSLPKVLLETKLYG